jgi:hypothetical protein
VPDPTPTDQADRGLRELDNQAAERDRQAKDVADRFAAGHLSADELRAIAERGYLG